MAHKVFALQEPTIFLLGEDVEPDSFPMDSVNESPRLSLVCVFLLDKMWESTF
jgi:hypothetical protein